MKITGKAAVLVACTAALGFGGAMPVPHCVAQTAQSQSATSRTMGTVKAVTGNGLTLTTDAGVEVSVVPGDNARIVRTAPGQRNLTGATPIQLSEIQAGDRILIRGSAAGDGKSFVASNLVVMSKADIADKKAREIEDWQKRGIGGRVTAVDPAAGTVAVAAGSIGTSQTTTIRVSPNTVVRRYAPDSVKFDDATKATLDQIKVGDQLRARGARSADGAELAAEEIVAGTFHNIAATVISADAANHTLTVKDLATKKPVVVKISNDSQMRKLAPMMAQMIAMRLKGRSGGGQAGQARMARANGEASGARPNGEGNGVRPNGGRGDINQMLANLPAVTLAELQKGDALMIVTTQGTGTSVTAITLLSGVEPILEASPDGMMILSAWNLSTGSEAAQ